MRTWASTSIGPPLLSAFAPVEDVGHQVQQLARVRHVPAATFVNVLAKRRIITIGAAQSRFLHAKNECYLFPAACLVSLEDLIKLPLYRRRQFGDPGLWPEHVSFPLVQPILHNYPVSCRRRATTTRFHDMPLFVHRTTLRAFDEDVQMTVKQFTTAELAIAAGRCKETIRRLAADGVIPYDRTSGNHLRFDAQALDVVVARKVEHAARKLKR